MLSFKMRHLKGALWAIALLVSLQSVICKDDDTPENYDKAIHCCKEPSNLMDGDCRNSSKLKCSAFLADPWIEPTDQFQITEDGELSLGLELIEHDNFCVARYEPTPGESRYIARVCFVESLQSSPLSFVIKGSLALVSVIFLGLTIYVYHIIVMRDTQDRVVRIALYCLMAFYLFLGGTQLFTDLFVEYVPKMCSVVAILVHFFGLSYFSWINVVMANMWKSVVVPRWSVSEYKWYMWNHIYGWSVPLFVEAILLTGHFTGHPDFDPRIGTNSCWFESDKESLWYMYIPITIMLFVNIVLFTWTSIVLYQNGSDFHPEKRNALKYRVMMYLRLFLLVGLTWIFEVMSFVATEHIIWFVFDAINALHGFLLFLVLVVFRSRVKRELAGKRVICGLRAPEHWRHNLDIEHQRLEPEEDEGTIGLQAHRPLEL